MRPRLSFQTSAVMIAILWTKGCHFSILALTVSILSYGVLYNKVAGDFITEERLNSIISE